MNLQIYVKVIWSTYTEFYPHTVEIADRNSLTPPPQLILLSMRLFHETPDPLIRFSGHFPYWIISKSEKMQKIWRKTHYFFSRFLLLNSHNTRKKSFNAFFKCDSSSIILILVLQTRTWNFVLLEQLTLTMSSIYSHSEHFQMLEFQTTWHALVYILSCNNQRRTNYFRIN